MRFLLAFVALAAVALPTQAETPPRRAEAVFAGGCFWCTEADFDKISGVLSTTSGYIGGKVADPTYEQVSNGTTGHIEAVRVVYDPAKVTYATLVERFFRTVDPLDDGGQFCDRGAQYRSAIFVKNTQQKGIAQRARARVAALLKGKGAVATLILPRTRFYPAESYHQDYYRKNPLPYRFYRYSCGRDARLKRVWNG
jgi:peptide-methionine (S)-S-oxide reductase